MNKTKKWAGILLTLLCAFILSLSLGVFCACNAGEKTAENAESGIWYYGASAPQGDLGKEGDYYLNTSNLASYVKSGAEWREVSTEEAVNWYYGTAAPVETLGLANDFYLNTKTGELYQKGADSWGTPILTLKGTPGRDGVMWFSGNGAPDALEDALKPKDAQKGDFYLDYSEFDVYQFIEKDGVLTWTKLGSIKGPKGEDAKDPIQFYDGKGDPYTEENQEKLAEAQVGDLYLGRFSGLEDGSTSGGSRLYRYLNGKWEVLMESMVEGRVNIYTYEQLLEFAGKVSEGTDYTGKEVHLKTDIDFEGVEGVSLYRAAVRAVTDWTPIGTSDRPFRGTFDGEGHKIENFTVTSTDDAQAVGFFGYVEGATIEHLHFVNAEIKASGAGSVAGVVVGEVKGTIEVNDVTVTTSTVTATNSSTAGGLVGQAQGDITVQNAKVEDSSVTSEGATAGGVVGKLEGGELTNVTVSGSSFTGEGMTDLIGDRGTTPEENVSAKDTSIADENGAGTEWNDQGETKMTYAVSGEASLIEKLQEVIASGGEMGIVLTGDTNLNELPDGPIEDDGVLGPAQSHPKKESYVLGTSADKKVDLTIDLNGHNLELVSYLYRSEGSYVSYGRITAITVKNGSTLTITNSGKTGKLSLITCGKSPIEVYGTGSSATFKDVEVECKCTYSYVNSARLNATLTGFNPAINVTNGGTVNLLEGAHFTAFDDGSTLDPYHPDRSLTDSSPDYSMDTPNRTVTLYRVGYIVTVSAGTKSGSKIVKNVLNIDGATVDVGGMVTPFVVSDKYAELNFKSGTITSSSGSGCAVFLISDLGLKTKPDGQKDCGAIYMTGGTINMTGSAEAPEAENTARYGDYMIAITDNQTDAGNVYVSGGMINLMPTSGIAVGIAAYPGGAYGKKLYQVGGNVTINVQAKENGYAAALACASVPQFFIYQGLNIKFENGSDTSPDTNKNVDFFWQKTLPWIEGKFTSHVFKGSIPTVGAEMGMIDERSTPMPENKK